MRTVLITCVIAASIAALLSFSKPGHQFLYKAGFPGACSSDDCGN